MCHRLNTSNVGFGNTILVISTDTRTIHVLTLVQRFFVSLGNENPIVGSILLHRNSISGVLNVINRRDIAVAMCLFSIHNVVVALINKKQR